MRSAALIMRLVVAALVAVLPSQGFSGGTEESETERRFVVAMAENCDEHVALDARWVPIGRSGVPKSAIKSGIEPDGMQQYVCRAQHEGHWIPGKLHKSECHVGYNGVAYQKSVYEVLTGNNDDRLWLAPSVGEAEHLMSVVAGTDPRSGDLKVCRKLYRTGWRGNVIDRGWHGGKENDGKCFFTYGGSELDEQGLHYGHEVLYYERTVRCEDATPIRSCKIEYSEIPCGAAGIPMARDFGCGVKCGPGYRPSCTPTTCIGNTWTESRCVCIRE